MEFKSAIDVRNFLKHVTATGCPACHAAADFFDWLDEIAFGLYTIDLLLDYPRVRLIVMGDPTFFARMKVKERLVTMGLRVQVTPWPGAVPEVGMGLEYRISPDLGIENARCFYDVAKIRTRLTWGNRER